MKFPIAIPLLAFAPVVAGQTFAPEHSLTDVLEAAADVFPADLDGDGDIDVLLGSGSITWVENLGGGIFSPAHPISSSPFTPADVQAVDLDGDGDLDVLSRWQQKARIRIYENLGQGNFGPVQLLVEKGIHVGATNPVAADLDGDGDLDVLLAFSGATGFRVE